jgi:GrpB-like predicted nucleotidyltransferase (UPF0157 family)
MLSLVRDIGRVDLFNLAMAEAGYEPWGEYPIAGRRFFTRGGDQQGTHNVHVFEAGNPEVARHLDFLRWMGLPMRPRATSLVARSGGW